MFVLIIFTIYFTIPQPFFALIIIDNNLMI